MVRAPEQQLCLATPVPTLTDGTAPRNAGRIARIMLWYVDLMTISATAVLGWVALELLGRPIRALLDLRRSVHEQMLVVGNIPLPNPRETAVSSREIREYDEAMRNLRQAQCIFRELGSQLLAFGENEPVAANAAASIGLNSAAAGSALIGLSVSYSRPDTDRAGLRNQIENALRHRNS